MSYLFFSLAAFNICSLYLVFISLINMCLGVFHLGFILLGTLWVSWTWVVNSFLTLGKLSTIISSSVFSCPLSLSYSSGTPMIRVGAFNIVPKVSEVVLISFNYFFSFLLSASFISTILFSTSLILSYASVILLLIPSRVLLI